LQATAQLFHHGSMENGSQLTHFITDPFPPLSCDAWRRCRC